MAKGWEGEGYGGSEWVDRLEMGNSRALCRACRMDSGRCWDWEGERSIHCQAGGVMCHGVGRMVVLVVQVVMEPGSVLSAQ